MNAIIITGKRLWKDDGGGVLSTEYLILGTILAIGLIVGIAAVRDSLVAELGDYAEAICGIQAGEVLGPDEEFAGAEGGVAP